MVYEALATAAREQTACAMATVIRTTGSMPRHTGAKMLIYATSASVGTVGGGAMEARVVAVARECLRDRVARIETYVLNSLTDGDPGVCGGTAEVFIEPVVVPQTLLVIGGGHVGQALAELGKWAGFRVILCDDRPEYASEVLVAGLAGYVVCQPSEVLLHVTVDAHTVICAVTRGLPVDIALFPALLATDAPYIGLIGSRRRWALTRQALMETGITPEQLTRVHAPIGLEIGAETPREIALSILAEVVMMQRGGTGKPMQWHG